MDLIAPPSCLSTYAEAKTLTNRRAEESPSSNVTNEDNYRGEALFHLEIRTLCLHLVTPSKHVVNLGQIVSSWEKRFRVPGRGVVLFEMRALTKVAHLQF